MAVRLKLKNSVIKDKAPLPADLEIGELAINAHQDSPAAYIKDNTGAIVKLAGAGNVGATAASATAAGVVQLADAAAITAGTAGRVVDAAQLKAVSDGDDWTRTGTTLAPKTTGDVVSFSAGTAALPGLTLVGNANTGLFSPGTNEVGVSVNGKEQLRINENRRLLLGTSSWYTLPDPVYGNPWTQGQQIKVSDTIGAYGGLAVICNASNANDRSADISLNRQDNAADYAALVGNLRLGSVSFNGANGTKFVRAASITAFVDGAIGANAMPGSLVFSTTAAGAAAPTSRLRIGSDGTSTFTSAASTPPVIFKIGTSEAARIDGNGRLGIGTSSPSTAIVARAYDTGNVLGGSTAAISVVNADSTAYGRTADLAFHISDASAANKLAGLSAVYRNSSPQPVGDLVAWTNNGSGIAERLRISSAGTSTFTSATATPPAIFNIGTSEAARIDANGRLLVGASATVAGSAAKLQCTTTANLGAVAVYADNAAAKAGGLVAGDIYRKADGTLMITF